MTTYVRHTGIAVSYKDPVGSPHVPITRVLQAHTTLGTDISVGEASFVVPTLDDLGDATEWSEVTVSLTASGTGWLSTKAYATGDQVVAPDGNLYTCILAHTNHQPPNATYWTVVTGHTAPWVGYIVALNPTYYPRGIAVTCKGYLVKCDTTEMEDPAAGAGHDVAPGGLLMVPNDLSGRQDDDIVQRVLDKCGLTGSGADLSHIGTTGQTWGTHGLTPFLWSTGQSGLSFLQQLDAASYSLQGGNWLGWRTFDDAGGVVRRTQIDMVPGLAPSHVFTEGVDIFDAPGQRDALARKDKIIVTGYDRGNGAGAVNYTVATGTTALSLSNPMIERQTEADDTPPGFGMSCEAVATGMLRQWSTTQERFPLSTPRDDPVAVGETVEVDFAANSRFATPAVSTRYWAQRVERDVAPDGAFTQVLTLVSGS